MPNVFTLDSIRAEVDKEFGPFRIPLEDGTEVTLRNPLRLNDATRKQVFDLLDQIKGGDDEESDKKSSVDDLSKTCSKILHLIGSANVKQLLKEIDGDVALMIEVIKTWTENTQLGEAENSPVSSTNTASS